MCTNVPEYINKMEATNLHSAAISLEIALPPMTSEQRLSLRIGGSLLWMMTVASSCQFDSERAKDNGWSLANRRYACYGREGRKK
jgi:hypothetical protein